MKLPEAEVNKLRLLLVFAAIAVTGWGIFLDQSVESQSGLMLIRVLLSILCLAGLVYTFLKPVTRFSYDLILFVCAFFILSGSVWMLEKTNYSMSLVVANIVTILTALSVIRNRYFAVILSVLYILNYLPIIIFKEEIAGRSLIFGYVVLSLLAGGFIHFTRHDLEKTIHEKDMDFQKQQEVIINQQAALAHASRLTAMGEMAGGIAHEINNPLTIIAGRVEQLQQMNESENCKKEDVDLILFRMSETIFRIKKLITSMKSLFRNYEKDPFESCDITVIIQDTLDLCMEGFKSQGIQFSYEIPAGVNVDCRPWQISQVLLNLFSNSKDAIKNLNEKWIRLRVEFGDGKVYFRVTDSGKGIPKEVISKMMQPFFTTKEVGKGTGLGLSISLGIARSHRGDLFVNQNSPNTELVLVIPQKQL